MLAIQSIAATAPKRATRRINAKGIKTQTTKPINKLLRPIKRTDLES
jgi:hypothetical protein